MCAVEVSGHSYLDVTADGRGTRESAPISLKGSDRGVQRVLDYHGVSLAECVQTFDVMQVSGRKHGSVEQSSLVFLPRERGARPSGKRLPSTPPAFW